MSMLRITIPLLWEEKSALLQLAETEMREPREQARFILCQELKRRGFLQSTPNIPQEDHY